jgi:uncharacterized protein YecE (DUF72 family)
VKLTIPEEVKPNLRIGTCSWKYDSWKGLIYDKGKFYRPDDYLADYSRHLNSVEIDQWFWSLFPGDVKLPELGTVKKYTDSVPEDFLFSVKAPNSLTLTHFYAKQPPRYTSFAGKPNDKFLDIELLEQFLYRLAPMGKKLGPIMFQFEYLNKKKMSSKEVFFDRLHEFFLKAPKKFSYAIETRNPNYLSSEFFQFLKEHKLGFVYLEGYYMPPIGDVYEKFKPETADFSIIRLHGGDRQQIEAETGNLWHKVVSPQPKGLQAAARIVKDNSAKDILTYVNVNNHFEGSAPLTIERFGDTLINLSEEIQT